MAIDYLGRQEFVDTLVKVVQQLAANHKGCTFAINGKWGCGKTFVLDRFEEQISIFQDPNAAGDRYYVLRYNCWQYDYYEEPAVALVAAMLDAVREQSRLFKEPSEGMKAFFDTVLDISESIFDQMVSEKLGFSLSELKDLLMRNKNRIHRQRKAAHDYDSYYSFKQQLDALGTSLSKLAAEKPIIILVDELDRCMPAYAITVLERLHHIFNEQSNVITILAVDQERLESSITQIYGAGRENELVSDYLKKFISFSLYLDTGTISGQFWETYRDYLALFEIPENDQDLVQELPVRLFKGIDARTQEKIMERIILLHQLSFDSSVKLPVSVMFFELLHQIVAYRCRAFLHTSTDDVETFLVNLSSHSHVVDKMDHTLYSYLVELERHAVSVTTSNIHNGYGYKKLRMLRNTSLSTAFRWFAQISNLKKGNDSSDVSPYHIGSSFGIISTESDPQPGIELFASLASKMEYR